MLRSRDRRNRLLLAFILFGTVVGALRVLTGGPGEDFGLIMLVGIVAGLTVSAAIRFPKPRCPRCRFLWMIDDEMRISDASNWRFCPGCGLRIVPPLERGESALAAPGGNDAHTSPPDDSRVCRDSGKSER